MIYKNKKKIRISEKYQVLKPDKIARIFLWFSQCLYQL